MKAQDIIPKAVGRAQAAAPRVKGKGSSFEDALAGALFPATPQGIPSSAPVTPRAEGAQDPPPPGAPAGPARSSAGGQDSQGVPGGDAGPVETFPEAGNPGSPPPAAGSGQGADRGPWPAMALAGGEGPPPGDPARSAPVRTLGAPAAVPESLPAPLPPANGPEEIRSAPAPGTAPAPDAGIAVEQAVPVAWPKTRAAGPMLKGAAVQPTRCVLDRPRDPVADRREAPDASPPAGSRLEAGHPGRMTEGPDPQGLEPNLPEGAGAHVQSGPAVPEASAAAEAGSQGSTPGQPAQNGASAPSGPAANGPGKNPPVESPDGAQRTPPEGAVGARGASGATGPVHVLNLRLEPPHLGPVRVRVRVEGESVQALFVTDAARQKAALDGGLPLLRHGLVEQGLSVQDLAVHVGSQDGGGGSYRRPQDGDGPVGPPPCRPSDLIPPGPERPEAAATVLRPGGALDVRI